MEDNQPKMSQERRRNPARRRAMVDIKYEIIWNDDRRTFDVYRAEAKTGAFARDKATAIGLAILDAQQEPPDFKVAVLSSRDGKTIVEWSR